MYIFFLLPAMFLECGNIISKLQLYKLQKLQVNSVWDYLDRKVNEREPHCQNIQELWNTLCQEWQQFPHNRLQRFVQSITVCAKLLEELSVIWSDRLIGFVGPNIFCLTNCLKPEI